MNINKQRYQKSNDTVNCGVFVAQYLRILSNGSFYLSIFSNSQTSLKSLRKDMHNVCRSPLNLFLFKKTNLFDILLYFIYLIIFIVIFILKIWVKNLYI